MSAFLTRLRHLVRPPRRRSRLFTLLTARILVHERLRFSETQILLFWAAVVGGVGGGASIVLRESMGLVHRRLTGQQGGLVESFAHLPPLERLLLPMAGGLAAGAVITAGRRFASSPHTTDYMEAVALRRGILSVRQSVVKIASAVASVSSGGSIGREGPIVQLSALAASLLGQAGRWSAPRRRVLVACGAAAGIAAAYDAPIAGALFVSEIMLHSIAMETLGPMVVASVMATQVVHQARGSGPLYAIPAFSLAHGWELPLYLLLGVASGLAAPLFLRVLRGSEHAFRALKAPPFLSMGLGGLLVGALAMRWPEVCGNGYSVVGTILNDHWATGALFAVLAAKVVATAATFGSGAVGGVFTPTLFTGAAFGYLFARACGAVLPAGALDPGAYALAGMGMFIAATTRAPLTAILIVFEMTLDPQVIMPLMLGSVAAFFTAVAVGDRSIYSDVLARKSLAAGEDAVADVLVRDLMRADPVTVPPDATFADIARVFIRNNRKYVFVVDRGGIFAGVVRLQDTKAYLERPDLADVVTARDLLVPTFPGVGGDDTLGAALEVFGHHDGERLPVLDPADGRLLGSLAKADVLLALAHGG